MKRVRVHLPACRTLRRRSVLLLATAAVTAAGLGVVPVIAPAGAQQPPVARQGLVIEPVDGWDVYTHASGTDYRVGPNLLRTTGSSQVWQLNCGPAFSGPTEVIRRMFSANGGQTFVGQTTILQPTPGSADSAGVCDPSLVAIGDYVYLAYTGTSAAGVRQVFVARSTNVDGPYTKWNGTGWGGSPAPIGLVPGIDGAAGPSLVVVGNTLHVFFQVRVNGATFQTRVATATFTTDPANQSTWPGRLQAVSQPAIMHPQRYPGVDCVGGHWNADTDVKYDDNTGRFIAVTTDQTYPWTVLQAYETAVDGLTFTRATITRGDYQQGARNPGILGDWSGHVPAGAPTAVAYARSSTCGYADMHWSTTKQLRLTTGAISEPLTNAARWKPNSGTWQISPGGYYEQTQDTENATYESSLGERALSSASFLTVAVKTAPNSVSRVGVHFDKAHPDDTIDQSGYVATVSSGGDVCLYKAGFGKLACERTLIPAWDRWVQLRIVQADGMIKVYLNGDSRLGIAFTDDHHPYLGGYLGLVTQHSTGMFANLQAGDNMPGTLSGVDWKPSIGQWTASGGRLNTLQSPGQNNLQDNTGLSQYVPSQLGDGTYAATMRVTGTSVDPTSWVGMVVTANGVTGYWGNDGYLVFVRANGNLGVFKGGTGQVVADVPTGTSPTTQDVRIRVEKTRANIQVYVNDRPTPLVNWTDTQAYLAVGGFGVANLGTPGSFTNLTYDGDYAR